MHHPLRKGGLAMTHPRILMRLTALLLTAALLLLTGWMLRQEPVAMLPRAAERSLLRIWVTSSVGGGTAWLKEQLRAWEKAHPGVMTYLRTVSPEEAVEEGAVLPDLILYMPGDFAAPEAIFSPLTGSMPAREALLRAGRWQGSQYGLPLCWGAWVLALDGALEPELAATPAPTTLLGRPAVTLSPLATPAPGFPLEAASQAEIPLQAPQGAGLFALSMLLEEKPELPADFALLPPAEVYSGFRARKYASAMLTTGQITAFSSLTGAGKGFPFRVMVPEEIITDQLWLGSVVQGAAEEAVALLAHLIAPEAQKALGSQGLHTVREDLRLYVTGTEAQVESAAARGLTAINAYVPAEDAASAAWRVFEGRENLSEALMGLI